MEKKLRQIMSQVFEVPIEEITENTSPDTVDKWDSLQHMNLILALEETFNITFSSEEITEMLNYKLIVMTLREHGIKI